MPGQPIILGPWRGALNLADPETLPEDMLQIADDVDIETNGELIERLAYKTSTGSWGWTDIQDIYLEVIGRFKHVDTSGFVSMYSTFIATIHDTGSIETNQFIEAKFSIDVEFSHNPNADIVGGYTDAVQHKNKAYILNSSPTFSGVWTPNANPVLGGTFVALTAMPLGFKAVVFKGRLFVLQNRTGSVSRSRIVYSEPDTATTDWDTAASWPSTNYFDVGGAEDDLTGAIVFNDQLYIFKQDSTWVFDFQAVPGIDGVLRKINSSIGATDIYCYTADDTTIYVEHSTGIYRLINNIFYKISENVVQIEEELDNVLFIWNNRLISSRQDGLWYVYNTIINSWTRWKNMDHPRGDPVIEVDDDGISSLIWLLSPNLSGKARQLSLADSFYPTFTVVGSKPAIRLKTKNYDFATPDTWKRIFYWSINFKRGKSDLTCVAFRDENSPLDETTPISETPNTTTIVTASSVARVFNKLKGAFRFRQINFEITSTYPAGITPAHTSRTKFFNIVAYIADASRFSKEKNVS